MLNLNKWAGDKSSPPAARLMFHPVCSRRNQVHSISPEVSLICCVLCPQWVLCGWSLTTQWIWSRSRRTTPTWSWVDASDPKTARRCRRSPSSSRSANETNTLSTGYTTCTPSCRDNSLTTESTLSTRYAVTSLWCQQMTNWGVPFDFL